MGMSKKRIRAAREELTRRGVLIDSGDKRRNPKTGKREIVWKLIRNSVRNRSTLWSSGQMSRSEN